jgi:2-polyprenyl-6-methoxyphenol hydroxylase-like FAD-dependent oxidoreductase
MSSEVNIFIIGAGPTGFAAALFLAERGHRARIIEKHVTPAPWSKAFGVNARSLSLLSTRGVTAQFFENGRRMEQLNLHRRGRTLATLRLDQVDDPFPFMLVQSQADSERLIETALCERGIKVDRGIEAVTIERHEDGAKVQLRPGNLTSTVIADCVLDASGASSLVRKSLGIAFGGEAYDEPWQLFDVELDNLPMPRDDENIIIHDDGGMFLVRHYDNLWRVLGNVPNMLDHLPQGTKIGRVQWESDFEIANRVASRFAEPPFFLAGDAAHIHSGIGARGMNLGIEDAYVFASLYDREQLDRYDKLRRPVVEKVVSQIKRAMGPPRPSTVQGRIVRAAPRLVLVAVNLVRSTAERWLLGLDHELGA